VKITSSTFKFYYLNIEKHHYYGINASDINFLLVLHQKYYFADLMSLALKNC